MFSPALNYKKDVNVSDVELLTMQDEPELDGRLPGFPGHVLREAREELGSSQKEVARDLHLTPKVINAIEESNFELLPGAAFARGYIRSYARHVGLDGPALVAEFDAVYGSPNLGSKPMAGIYNVSEQSKPGDTWVKLISFVLVLGLLVVSVVWWQSQNDGLLLQRLTDPVAQTLTADITAETTDSTAQSSNNTNNDSVIDEVAEALEGVAVEQLTITSIDVAKALPTEEVKPKSAVSEPLKTAEVAAATVTKKVDDQTPPAPLIEAKPKAVETAEALEVISQGLPLAVVKVPVLAANESMLLMVFAKDCWVEIKDSNGKMILSDLYSAGSRIEQVVTAPIEILLGRSSGITNMEFDGKTIDLEPHTRKDIARLTLNK